MDYPTQAIADQSIPAARVPLLQHAIETYAGETNKVASVWSQFTDEQWTYKPHPKSTSVGDIMKHQLLSERRFFGEFLATPEPPPDQVLPAEASVAAYRDRLVQLALPRLAFLADQEEAWWLTTVPFFDVERQRVWVFWRRVLHTAHHRTQLTVYLRLLDQTVVATYGPTADVTWKGADPTLTVEAAGRRTP